MTATFDFPSPMPATHAWCPICRTTTPIRYAALAPASSARMGGRYDGDRMCCARCDAPIATVLVKTTEGAA